MPDPTACPSCGCSDFAVLSEDRAHLGTPSQLRGDHGTVGIMLDTRRAEVTQRRQCVRCRTTWVYSWTRTPGSGLRGSYEETGV